MSDNVENNESFFDYIKKFHREHTLIAYWADASICALLSILFGTGNFGLALCIGFGAFSFGLMVAVIVKWFDDMGNGGW